jgi:hypothetical protein
MGLGSARPINLFHLHPLPLYAITPAQIVTTMITLYGVATGTDLQRLREPLLEPLNDLEPFMAKFKLNTLKLTASGYGKSPYDYFEAFLTTLQGFPIVATSMSTFYAQHPRVADHTIANLFPFLIPQIPFLLAQSNASPFSGASFCFFCFPSLRFFSRMYTESKVVLVQSVFLIFFNAVFFSVFFLLNAPVYLSFGRLLIDRHTLDQNKLAFSIQPCILLSNEVSQLNSQFINCSSCLCVCVNNSDLIVIDIHNTQLS